jgi:hypothetical protein
VLRAKFAGEPEHAINFFFMVAENMREHMAAMGFRNVDDMIGRADMLEVNQDVIKKYPRLAGINLDKILLPAARLRENVAQRCVRKQVTASGVCLTEMHVQAGDCFWCLSDPVWCGLVWPGVLWSGLVWSGLVWCFERVQLADCQ